MNCQTCNKDNCLIVSIKCSEYGTIRIDGKKTDTDMSINNTDYIDFVVCIDCGHMQGNFPVPIEKWKNLILWRAENKPLIKKQSNVK